MAPRGARRTAALVALTTAPGVSAEIRRASINGLPAKPVAASQAVRASGVIAAAPACGSITPE
jgi:hypothetical protein